MKVSKEEILHIANLADLKIDDAEIDNYIANLDDILDYVKVLETAPISNLDETIGAINSANVFRKDEVNKFDNVDGLLSNAKDIERNMYKIPKVL